MFIVASVILVIYHHDVMCKSFIIRLLKYLLTYNEIILYKKIAILVLNLSTYLLDHIQCAMTPENIILVHMASITYNLNITFMKTKSVFD